MSTNSSTARPSVILATLAALAIVLAVCATAATVLVATDATRQHAAASAVAGIRPEFTAARGSWQRVGELGPLVDSLVAELGSFPVADSGQIAIMARLRVYPLPAAVRQAAESTHPVWIALPDSVAVPDGLSVDGDRLTRALSLLATDARALVSTAEHSDLTLAAADTLTSWLGRWRTHARSAPYAPMWGYRAGLPGVESAFDLPPRNGQSLYLLAQLNALTGWVALRRDDGPLALERALENLAASRHHLESPLVSELRWGTRIAASGAELALAVAMARGDSVLAQRARAVQRRTALSMEGMIALGEAAIADAADPAAPVAMELFEDDKLPFAVRAEILYATLAGSCRNTREVLFGFSPLRETQLQALAARWQAHPSLGPVLGLMPAAARTLRERPVSLLPADRWPSSGVLDFLLPEATAARAVLCQQPF